MRCRRLTVFVLALISLPASAEVYKCRQPDGSSVISNSPCSEGSKTIKTVPSDTVSEASREQAEKNADRLEEYADKLEARRLAQEEVDRKERERLAAIAASTPAPTPAPAPVVQPIYLPQPGFYGRPNYNVQPRQPHDLSPGYPPPVQMLPAPPIAQPIAPPAKPLNIYQVPGKYQAH